MKDIQGGINKNDKDVPAKCPQCDELMANMGLDFKSPKQDDIKSWSHLESLYQVGIAFHSCGCTGPGYIPSDKNELIEHFQKIRANYLEHQHFWARRREHPTTQSEIDKDQHRNGDFLRSVPKEFRTGKHSFDSSKAQVYWNNKVKEIERKISLLN